MRTDECARILPVLPEWLRGEMEEAEARSVEAHVAACADCGTGAELLRALAGTREEPPPGLAERIKDALRAEEKGGDPVPGTRWGWSAVVPRVAAVAAVLLLAATVLLLPEGWEGGGEAERVELALESGSEVWLSDDGIVAGAPLLVDLSEEELVAVLEEMEP